MKRHVVTVATLALGFFCPQLAAAPSQGARYAVTGSIIDQTHALVPKAQVILTEISRGKKHKTRSDGDGRFGFDDLPPGDYVLDATLPGFASVKANVSVATQDVTLNVGLEVGGLYEAVTITRAQAVTRESDTRTYPRREPPACKGPTERPIGGNILPPIKIRDIRPI